MKLSTAQLRPRALPVLAALLFLVVFALFAPSVRYEFLTLDDTDYVSKNALVLSGLSPRGILDAFSAGLHGGMYMPLLWVSYMADVTLFGASSANPAPFHAVNVALHAANALLFLFLLLRLIALSRPSSLDPCHSSLVTPFLLSLLWALHPLRVESVAWITERKDVLSLFFALLSLLAYLHRPQSASPSRGASGAKPPSLVARPAALLLSVLFFAASLLVKPSLVPFPFLLVLLDLFVLRRPLSFGLFLRKTPWFLLAAAAAVATLVGHGPIVSSLPLATRLAHVPQTLAHYLFVTLVPRHLAPLDPRPAFALFSTFADALFLLAFFLCAIRLRRAALLSTLGILWFFLFLMPFSGLATIPNNTVADRFSYVSALGLSVALLPLFRQPGGSGTTPLSSRPAPRWNLRQSALDVLLLAAIAACAFLTHRLLPAWRSSDALYARVRRFSPDNRFLAIHDFRHAIADSGDYAAARDIALRALALDPADTQFVVCLASCIANLDGPRAAFDFLAARRPTSGHFLGEWAWEMATLALRLGRPGDALSFADLADSALTPGIALRGNVARLRTAASSSDPVDALPHYVSQWMAYERADALEFFRRLLAAHPDRPDFLANVAWFLSTSNWSPAPPSEALGYASRALALAGPRPPPELLDTSAAALANASDFPAAAAAEQRAIALLPPDSPSLSDYQARLALYRRALPFRRDIGLH